MDLGEEVLLHYSYLEAVVGVVVECTVIKVVN